MNSQILGLRVAGTIFGLICLAQLLRLVTRVEVLVAGHQVPLWPSAIAVVIAGGLSVWLWRLSAKGGVGPS
jgi:energy-coupling factor transporter transmembrane protein EcfT